MKKCFVMVLLCCLLVAGTAFAKTGTLLVAFGTSMDSARPAIDDIEKAYKKAAGNEPVLLAFTSDIIRNKLAKEGKPVLSVNAAMNELAAQGVTDLKIQSLHIAPAEEYNQLERMVVKNITKNPGVFKTVKVGYPLLVSEKDLDAVVKTRNAYLRNLHHARLRVRQEAEAVAPDHGVRVKHAAVAEHAVVKDYRAWLYYAVFPDSHAAVDKYVLHNDCAVADRGSGLYHASRADGDVFAERRVFIDERAFRDGALALRRFVKEFQQRNEPGAWLVKLDAALPFLDPAFFRKEHWASSG